MAKPLVEAKWHYELLLPFAGLPRQSGVTVWSQLYAVVLRFLQQVGDLDPNPTLYRLGQLPGNEFVEKLLPQYGSCLVLGLLRLGSRERWVFLREQTGPQGGAFHLVRLSWPHSWDVENLSYRDLCEWEGDNWVPSEHAAGYTFQYDEELVQEVQAWANPQRLVAK